MIEPLNFTISRHLDKGKTFAGQPYDQVLPALALFILCLVSRHEVVGLGLAFAWFFSLKLIKQSKGPYFLPMAFYWNAPAELSKSFFIQAPAAHKKYWRY